MKAPKTIPRELRKFPDSAQVDKFLNWLDQLLAKHTRKGATHAESIQ